MCDKRRSARSISVPGANNRLFCPASMTSLWHVSKHDRRGSIQQTVTAERKNVNAKRKTESDIRIFKNSRIDYQQRENSIIPKILESGRWTCTLKVFSGAHEIQTGLRTDSLKCIHASISIYLSYGECWLIDAIVSTIETYENRTITPISVSDNSVQSTVTNNNSVQ